MPRRLTILPRPIRSGELWLTDLILHSQNFGVLMGTSFHFDREQLCDYAVKCRGELDPTEKDRYRNLIRKYLAKMEERYRITPDLFDMTVLSEIKFAKISAGIPLKTQESSLPLPSKLTLPSIVRQSPSRNNYCWKCGVGVDTSLQSICLECNGMICGNCKCCFRHCRRSKPYDFPVR